MWSQAAMIDLGPMMQNLGRANPQWCHEKANFPFHLGMYIFMSTGPVVS